MGAPFAIGTTYRLRTRFGPQNIRLGGDEFGLLAIDTDRRAAVVIAERIRRTLAHQTALDPAVPITASIGVVTSTRRATRWSKSMA